MKGAYHAHYQLEYVMPLARQRGCKCKFDESDFERFLKYEWAHDKNCPSPIYENLPNASLLAEAMRHSRY